MSTPQNSDSALLASSIWLYSDTPDLYYYFIGFARSARISTDYICACHCERSEAISFNPLTTEIATPRQVGARNDLYYYPVRFARSAIISTDYIGLFGCGQRPR